STTSTDRAYGPRTPGFRSFSSGNWSPGGGRGGASRPPCPAAPPRVAPSLRGAIRLSRHGAGTDTMADALDQESGPAPRSITVSTRRRPLINRTLLFAYLLVTPAMALILGLVAYPFFYAIWVSFTDQVV